MTGAIDLDWELPDPFTIDLIVGAEHIDRYGHVNNLSYLTWCEDVAWAHSEAVGLGFADYQRLDRAMALRKIEIEYRQAGFSGERVRVANWIVDIGRLTAARRYQILRLDDGATLARARCDFVCIELGSGKPRRMPPEFVERYTVLPSVRAALETERARA